MARITYRTAEIDSRADRFRLITPDLPGFGQSATQIGAE
jgi:pimeloyl-ACP methyl ester carboxylesterase